MTKDSLTPTTVTIKEAMNDCPFKTPSCFCPNYFSEDPTVRKAFRRGARMLIDELPDSGTALKAQVDSCPKGRIALIGYGRDKTKVLEFDSIFTDPDRRRPASETTWPLGY